MGILLTFLSVGYSASSTASSIWSPQAISLVVNFFGGLRAVYIELFLFHSSSSYPGRRVVAWGQGKLAKVALDLLERRCEQQFPPYLVRIPVPRAGFRKWVRYGLRGCKHR